MTTPISGNLKWGPGEEEEKMALAFQQRNMSLPSAGATWEWQERGGGVICEQGPESCWTHSFLYHLHPSSPYNSRVVAM